MKDILKETNFYHIEIEEQKEIILNIIKKLDNKKQIRINDLMELGKLINIYSVNIHPDLNDHNDILPGFISDGCIDWVYAVQHPSEKVFLIDCDGYFFCREGFETNRECYKYIKDRLRKHNVI